MLRGVNDTPDENKANAKEVEFLPLLLIDEFFWRRVPRYEDEGRTVTIW